MAKRSDFMAMAALTVLFSYLLAVGATFNGILFPEFHTLTLGLMALVVGGWLFSHWSGGWKWHQTSLDRVFLLWALAFGVSLVANSEVWRRIAIGLWYMGVYIGVWYMVHDMMANRALKREVIIDALLISGFVIVLLGFLQLQLWLRQVLATGLYIVPPRPVSVFGNPNFLSDFLIVLTPLTLSRLVSARKRMPKILLGIYVLLQIVLLVLTNSRGAWIGAAVSLVVWGVLVLGREGDLSWQRVSNWWKQQSATIKGAAISVGLLGVVGVLIFAGVISRSLAEPGRGTGLRTEIYTAAVELFKEKPLTGQGLFTFGRGLVQLPGIHPDKPHSHAHDAPLHIAAELGLLGLAALVVTLWVGYRRIGVNWKVSTARERLLLAGAVGGVVAFAVHQLTDVPAMMPAIALTGLIALILALVPKEPELVNATWARTGHLAEMVGIWVVVLAAGFWSSGIYSNYVGILSDAAKNGNYQQDAERLNAVISSDPQLSLYYMQQGFLYGMAASEGDLEAAKAGIAAYQKAVELDSGYGVVWANLATLQWQVGAQDEAISSLQKAIQLDGVEWDYPMLLGQYAEAMGQTNVADGAYQQALTLYPDASLYTELGAYVQAHPTVVDPTTMTVAGQVVWYLNKGDIAQAEQIWSTVKPDSAPAFVTSAVLGVAKGDADWAASALSQAEKLATSPVEQAWLHMGKARLAGLLGNGALVEDEVKAARAALVKTQLASDDETLINIAYAQFLQVAIERQYLPQLNYRTDPVLLNLLANTQ